MRPDAEEIEKNPNYRQMKVLDYNEMIPFVISNIKHRSFISFLYIGLNAMLVLTVLLIIVSGLMTYELIWSVIIKQTLAGIFCGSILIIPVHELLHGFAYRILGARKIKFGADFQQFIFFVTADRYPVSGKELVFLAMTPFVFINLVTFLAIICLLPNQLVLGGFLLLSHNIMCIGDFAMVNYVFIHARNRLFTFDEVENKKCYFYEEVADES